MHQPRPCIEAGEYYKPVILSDYPETKEYFKEDYNALVFQPGNARELAYKIRYAEKHKSEMAKLGEHNRTMTETKHNFYICKKQILALIERVCKDAH